MVFRNNINIDSRRRPGSINDNGELRNGSVSWPGAAARRSLYWLPGNLIVSTRLQEIKYTCIAGVFTENTGVYVIQIYLLKPSYIGHADILDASTFLLS